MSAIRLRGATSGATDVVAAAIAGGNAALDEAVETVQAEALLDQFVSLTESSE
jgi:hypothetical protein